jgi:hypothetical protein
MHHLEMLLAFSIRFSFHLEKAIVPSYLSLGPMEAFENIPASCLISTYTHVGIILFLYM